VTKPAVADTITPRIPGTGNLRARSDRAGLALGLFGLTAILAGQTTGSISGRVTDTTGAPLAGAKVEAVSSSLPGKRTAATGRDGTYRLPAVPPGIYMISASFPAFRQLSRRCSVSLGSSMTVDLELQVETNEKVVVSGKTLIIDEGTTTTGTSYTNDVVAQLPVSRNYADIVRANPGVSIDPGGYTDGRFVTLSIYGATAQENQWIIDGVNTTQVKNGSQGKALNNEFIQEVSVMTGGYSVEYGRALGGVINAVTKSGGNEFHGGVFIYYDSNSTMAQQQFRPGDSGTGTMRIVDAQQYDYGADLGGFLLKDRLWFFAAYNGTNGDSQLARQVATTHVPTDYLFPLDTRSNYYSGKLTWNAASATTVVGSVFSDPSNETGLSGADPVNTDPSTWWSALKLGGTDYGVRVNQLFGSLVLATLQGSYHKDQSALTPPPGIRYVDNTCSGGTPDNPCIFPPEPNNIEGGYGFVGDGLNSNSTRKQLALGASLYVGDHEIKAGADYLNGQSEGLRFRTGGQQVFIQNEYGQLYYQHRFYASDPSNPTPIPGFRLQAQVIDYGAYVEDSWRVRPNVTVNVGLRWDGEDTRNYAGQSVFRFKDGWQPRVGVTWDPWSNGATKIYASAGRFAYGLPTQLAYGNFSSVPYNLTTYNFDPVDVTQNPNVISHPDSQVSGGFPSGIPVDNVIGAAYLDELSVGVERLVLPTLTVGIKGTYRSLNRALEDRCDFDYSAPQLNGSSCALINPGSTGVFASGDAPTCNGLNPPYDECYAKGPPMPPARRYYRGLEVVARDSVGTNLWLQASYVYSSLLGNYGAPDGVAFAFDYPAFLHNAYGALPLDRPNRFRFDGYWASPWGLTLGLAAFAETGAPLSKYGYYSDNYPYQSVFLTPRGSEGTLPALWGANLTLSYPIYFGPVVVTLQGYLYNIFNKQIAISKDEVWSYTQPPGYPLTIYDPNQPQTNTDYGLVTARSGPRLFRAAVKVSF
jgi:outer membrane receptor protein involved in Fe transport